MRIQAVFDQLRSLALDEGMEFDEAMALSGYLSAGDESMHAGASGNTTPRYADEDGAEALAEAMGRRTLKRSIRGS